MPSTFGALKDKIQSSYSEARRRLDERETIALARAQNESQKAKIKAETRLKREKLLQEKYKAQIQVTKAKQATAKARKEAGVKSFSEIVGSYSRKAGKALYKQATKKHKNRR